jgi:chromosome segregation protein
MKLTTLELLGFKSFLNRTAFRFDEGVTCIVGPNGCGKSNIVDAITWVLGERGTKSLRVKEMGDVIFHGSNAKKQVNMAEVTMGLMNEEREYAIKRRIYRDGTNEYYINGDMVRLKDIQDFFLGTGVGLHSYAIIEQGNIEYFAQMKPHERRLAVEETSGITRFEEKKRDAFSRMEEVKTNLERVEDLYREVTKNYEKAEEEAARLKVYNGLKEKLREFDIALLVDGHIRLTRRAGKLQEREQALSAEMEAKEAGKQGVREKMRSKEEEIALIDTVARQAELDIKGKEKDMESRLLELNYLDEEKKRLERTAADLAGEIAALSQKAGQYAAEVEAAQTAGAEETAVLRETEERGRHLEALREELKRVREALEKETEEERNLLFGAMTRLTEIKNRAVDRERILREREARQQRRLEEERLLSERLRLLQEKVSSLRRRMEEELAEIGRVKEEEQGLAAQWDGLAKEAGQLQSALEGLKGVKKGKEEIFRQMKSYGEGRKQAPSPYKQLIDILRPSKEAEQAMERFFSREMSYRVLSEHDAYNLSIIAKEYGEDFIFFPKKGMFALHEGEADVRLTRVGSLPEAFQRIEAGEEGLFLAGNTLVDSRGFIRKGQDGSSLSIREFREKMKLETELAQIEEDLKAKASVLSELAASRKELEKARQTVAEKRRSKEQTAAAMEREIITAEAEMKTTGERLKEGALKAEPDGDEGLAPTEAEEAVEKERWEKEKERIDVVLVDLRKRLEEAKEQHSRADEQFHQISIDIERSGNQLRKTEEETARKKAAIIALQKEKEGKEQKKTELERDLRKAVGKTGELEEGYRSLQEECAKATSRYEEMKGRLGDAHMERTSLRDEQEAIDKEIEKARVKKEGVEKERLVLEEKKEAIREKLREEYGVEEIGGEPLPVVQDDGERQQMLEELAALGEVNFRAEKERGELKERREFLDKQKTDLVQAMESLKKTITRIDAVSRELFLETFERVNDAFKRFTQTLFKGGQGALMLNQETNGIDLYVQPPGKKVIRMELLSGGEKALISLAFLLSLMDTKASPFTLLDEIDAPLDDANLLSLLDIVKAISRKTQIILITHNRMTMESSNTIYGITMEEAGVSKTISIKL